MKNRKLKKTSKAKCAVCGNTHSEAFSVNYRRSDYAVVQCSRCGFLFIPGEFRRRIDYTHYKSRETAREIAKADLWIKEQRNMLRYRLIRRYARSGRIFDIGCGFGHFLLTGKGLGYDVRGVEMSEANAQFIRRQFGIAVEQGDFLRIPLKREYDAVTLWDTLEHMDRPDLVLEKISRILKPGGVVFIQVPQSDSFFSRILRYRWWAVGLDHVNYFSRSTIRQILQRFGLETVEIKSSIELKNVLVYVILPELKRNRHPSSTWSAGDRQKSFNRLTRKPIWIRKLLVLFHNAVYHMLSFLRIGDEMIIVAVKK